MGLRERNAQAARAQIRRAALEAFLGDGYVRTTMTDIAHRAGVARQTVYNLYASKPALLIDVISDQVAAPGIRDQASDRASVLGVSDAGALLRAFAAAHRAVVERSAPIMRVALQAAAVDVAVAQHLDELEGARVAAMDDVVDALSAIGSLRGQAPHEEQRRGFALLTSPVVAIASIDGGMTLEELERWVALAAGGLLLAAPDEEAGPAW